MKLRRVGIENVRSFLDQQELQVPSEISIIIGPNGGGKTNLLDTAVLALRLFLLKSWMPRHSPTDDWQDRYDWINNDALHARLLEKHSDGAALPQTIELDLEVTQSDIENIARTKAEALELQERAKSRYTSFPGSSAASWNTESLKAGVVLPYRIVNGSLQPTGSPAADTFRSYLETYEVSSRMREEYERLPLSMPMISLPVNRSAGDVSASISLANFNEYDSKRTVDAASSRTAGSITSLAIGRLATRYRDLLERDDGHARQDFKDDPAIKAFTATLKSLGYDWELRCTNTAKNQYDIQLSKQGSSFRVGAASSGERELLTYLFAIYALNVRDALIVVDEPELHLHPRWQRTLLTMFERLSEETGNQFVMATHSPVFVSPSSIQYVSRVYADNQRSRVVRLGDSELPERKHLFSIVNSQNNERVFFADLVVLVEGISDRIFFEVLLQHFKLGEGTGKVYEIVSVGGKTLFSQYEKLLTACHVPYVIIADLDYAREIGGESLKSLFSISAQAIKQNVVDDPTSLDGTSLVARMDEAIHTGCIDDLKPLWEYVKLRQSRLRTDLTESEQSALHSFISEQRTAKRFILSRGPLEAYLPVGFKNKDLEKLIRLVAEPALWDRLPTEVKGELREIITSIAL
jgi:putative ATP-dependent endonuclease of OLD family